MIFDLHFSKVIEIVPLTSLYWIAVFVSCMTTQPPTENHTAVTFILPAFLLSALLMFLRLGLSFLYWSLFFALFDMYETKSLLVLGKKMQGTYI